MFYAKLGFEVVPDAEQRPALVEMVREEASRGLDRAARCVMRWRPRLYAPREALRSRTGRLDADCGMAHREAPVRAVRDVDDRSV